MSRWMDRSVTAALTTALAVTLLEAPAAGFPAISGKMAKGAADTIGSSVAPATSEPAHLEVQRVFDELLTANRELKRAVDTNDLQAFRVQAKHIQEELAVSRLNMDRAFLTGAWRSGALKRDAMDLINKMQSAQILSLMTVAISTGYEYPTQKVPDSAADAARRLSERLEQLSGAVRALNQSAG